MTDRIFRAKLVSLFNESETELGCRQLPLIIDETLTMVVQFDVLGNTCTGSSKANLSRFNKKYELFTTDELPEVLKSDEIMLYTIMSRAVPCVGCRRSVERLFGQLIESSYAALDPLYITDKGDILVTENLINNPKHLCSLFSCYGGKINSYIESIPRAKKSRRCLLHSLDSQKVRPAGIWLDVWEQMSTECQEEVVIIEQDVLYETVETYLRKHKFCGDCKSKVLQAYNLLVQEADSSKEKGFVASLYEGVKYCHSERHIHVKCDTDFVANLMSRAEPELRGSRKERHAKTIDVAQEEILVCIGVCLYERLHRISQRTKEEEQTWQILFYLCVECVQMNFELTVEKKSGVSQLEIVCEEIRMAELAQQQKREHKRLKKKERKNKLKCDGAEANLTLENDLSESFSSSVEAQDIESNSCSLPKVSMDTSELLSCSCLSGVTPEEVSYADSDYLSGSNVDSPWSSSPSSCDSSCDGAYAESCSSHEDDCPSCLWNKGGSNHPLNKEIVEVAPNISGRSQNVGISILLTLEEMLKNRPSDEEAYINPEELLEMKAKIQQTSQERLRFRENLKIRFQDFQRLSKFRFSPFKLSKHCLDL